MPPKKTIAKTSKTTTPKKPTATKPQSAGKTTKSTTTAKTARKAPTPSMKKSATTVTQAAAKTAKKAVSSSTPSPLASPKYDIATTFPSIPTAPIVPTLKTQRNYWLVKSEPFKWSWDEQCGVKQEHWDGVRNYQAANNMKAMSLGDLAFFYHSNEGKHIVGIVQCVKLYYPDPSDDTGRGFGMVDFAAVQPMPKAVDLASIKANPKLSDFVFNKQGRLSVCPCKVNEWLEILKMGGVV